MSLFPEVPFEGKSLEDTLAASGHKKPRKGGAWCSRRVVVNPLDFTRKPPTRSEALAKALRKELDKL